MDNKLLLYDTFNAKYLSFQDVSSSFVANEEYFNLTRNNSILLMGSRGCGKTTLLKMLTPSSLNSWNDPEAKNIKEKINFTAIYIPSDIQWKNQYNYLTKHLNNQQSVVEIITQFLFASNVQIAICKTFNTLLEINAATTKDKVRIEFDVCKELSKSWLEQDNISFSFDEIEVKILERVRFINALIKSKIFRNEINDFESSLPQYVFDNFFDLTKISCKIFENNLKLTPDYKWALCFDELEIVPKFIQLELLSYLRSVDQKFLFKLTTTPLVNIENSNLEASQSNDFSTIKLWVYDAEGRERWRNFCQKLIINRFSKNYKNENLNFTQIFGEYSWDEVIRDELNDLSKNEKSDLGYKGEFQPGTGRGSSMYFLLKRLCSIDPSMVSFLEKRGLDPKEPFSYNLKIQKTVFLKIKVDSIYRLIYKNRTRKTPPIHFGIPYIFDICDGNPRLMIGLIDEIFTKSNISNEKNISITKQEQSRIIYEASDKYFDLIKNHPDSTIIVSNSETNLALDLLDKIGNYMLDKLVKEDFKLGSPTTFIVDEELNHKYIKLLEIALSLGAIIYLDPIESLSNTGIVGKRFRLAGFLAPRYKIPTNRVQSEVRLSTLLKIKETNNQTKFDY